MKELSLSLMYHNDESLAVIQSVLDAFEKQFHIHVNLNVLNWETGYSELTRDAIYGRGPDVSEIGSTWVSALLAMNALRPFAPADLFRIGKPDEFLSASWSTGRESGDERMWAIPYTSNMYLINYRKDLLKQAGLDEATAFQSHAQIHKTVQQLSENGAELPIVLPSDDHTLLHSITSWIWGQGGDLCSPDGKQVLFDQPKSLAAIVDYFRLLKYVSPDGIKRANSDTSISLFCKGYAAIHFYDLSVMALEKDMWSPVPETWAWIPFPKPYFMGGTNLVVWQHSPRVEAAVTLIEYLTSLTAMAQLVVPFHMLPPRIAVMGTPEFSNAPLLKNLEDAANLGRSYPAVKLWGMIEKRFIAVLADIRATVMADPSVDLDVLVRQKIVPVAERLNIALTQ